MTPTLQAAGLRVRFGSVQALHDVDLVLEAGEITGLIGPNGAGKTTVIDVLMGFTALAAGDVQLDGRTILALPPHQRAARGMACTFQSLELFDDLTAGENLLVAARDDRDRVADAARRSGTSHLLDQVAATLGPGHRKAVALGRALAGSPRVLMLDEPAAGLDLDERQRLSTQLRDIAATGVAVLLVDHDLDLVLDVCDHVVVLDLGRVVYDGGPAGVRADPHVAAAYLGQPAHASTPASPGASPAGRATLARAQAMSAGYDGPAVVHDVDLHIDEGEAVALLGPNGAGKSTTLLALSGVLPRVHGQVEVLGAGLDRPHRMARRGLAHVLQDHKVFRGLSVADNMRLAGADLGGVPELFPALQPLLGQPAGALSGGEQQLLSLARALARQPRLLIVDELSLGLSPVAVTDLYDALRDWRVRTGGAVLFAEQHAQRALELADRAYVLRAGHIVLSRTSAELRAAPELLTRAYLGG